MKALLLIIAALASTAVAKADAVVTGVQVDTKNISFTVSIGECQVKLVPSAQLAKMAGSNDIEYEGILVTVNPIEYNCSPERITLSVAVTTPLNELVESALESLPKDKRTLPLKIQTPPVVTNI